MELVNLMYRYVNRFINNNELIKELKKIDICNYQDKEVINKLIKDIEEVREKTPNEIDSIKLTNRGIDLANLVWEEFV